MLLRYQDNENSTKSSDYCSDPLLEAMMKSAVIRETYVVERVNESQIEEVKPTESSRQLEEVLIVGRGLEVGQQVEVVEYSRQNIDVARLGWSVGGVPLVDVQFPSMCVDELSEKIVKTLSFMTADGAYVKDYNEHIVSCSVELSEDFRDAVIFNVVFTDVIVTLLWVGRVLKRIEYDKSRWLRLSVEGVWFDPYEFDVLSSYCPRRVYCGLDPHRSYFLYMNGEVLLLPRTIRAVLNVQHHRITDKSGVVYGSTMVESGVYEVDLKYLTVLRPTRRRPESTQAVDVRQRLTVTTPRLLSVFPLLQRLGSPYNEVDCKMSDQVDTLFRGYQFQDKRLRPRVRLAIRDITTTIVPYCDPRGFMANARVGEYSTTFDERALLVGMDKWVSVRPLRPVPMIIVRDHKYLRDTVWFKS